MFYGDDGESARVLQSLSVLSRCRLETRQTAAANPFLNFDQSRLTCVTGSPYVNNTVADA